MDEVFDAPPALQTWPPRPPRRQAAHHTRVGQGPACTIDAPQHTVPPRPGAPCRTAPPRTARVQLRTGIRGTAHETAPWHPRAGSTVTRGSTTAPRTLARTCNVARGATHTACVARLRPVQRCGAPRSAHAHDVCCELEPQALGRGRGGVARARLAGDLVGRPARTFRRAAVAIRHRAEHRCAGAVGCACAWPSCLFRALSHNRTFGRRPRQGAHAVFVQLEHSGLCWKVGKRTNAQSLCFKNQTNCDALARRAKCSTIE